MLFFQKYNYNETNTSFVLQLDILWFINHRKAVLLLSAPPALISTLAPACPNPLQTLPPGCHLGNENSFSNQVRQSKAPQA